MFPLKKLARKELRPHNKLKIKDLLSGLLYRKNLFIKMRKVSQKLHKLLKKIEAELKWPFSRRQFQLRFLDNDNDDENNFIAM